MPNVSELARVEAERRIELQNAVALATDLSLNKGAREDALRNVRRLERELGVEAIGNINGRPSAQQQQDEALTRTLPPITLTVADLRHIRRQLEMVNLTEAGLIYFALLRDGEEALAHRLYHRD